VKIDNVGSGLSGSAPVCLHPHICALTGCRGPEVHKPFGSRNGDFFVVTIDDVYRGQGHVIAVGCFAPASGEDDARVVIKLLAPGASPEQRQAVVAAVHGSDARVIEVALH
jgi:hypothetical protein